MLKEQKFKPINSKLPVFWHGGDYNPDQWIENPHIIEDDIRMMKKAKINVVSLGIFSWAQIEKTEGNFDFGWLDMIMDKLAENDIYVILATPSAAHPLWMSKKYPEVVRTHRNRIRNGYGGRVNYCLSSEIYREKCRTIDILLAERYKNHKALLMWHIGNEMTGECYCEKCRLGFREWVKEKYKTLENLNQLWWMSFWGHTYSDWDEVDLPAFINGNVSKVNQAQVLEFKRYMSYLNYQCYKNERDTIKKIIPDAVITTNTWRIFGEMDFSMFVDDMDVVGLDAYPQYHNQEDDYKIAQVFSFTYDLYRSMKGGKPFALIETSPGSMLAYTAQKLKRPNIHKMACMQAVAHGSDSVLYFQWRKGRGNCEKNHGAVIDHVGHENTRVFQDVLDVGNCLEKLTPIIGTITTSEVALVYDPQVLWLMDIDVPLHKTNQSYQAECVKHYGAFWDKGICVDVIHPTADFSKYKLIIAPMLYMQRNDLEQKIRNYVDNGGNFIATYLSQQVDEFDRCITGGYPGNLRDVFGIWSEEIDVLDNGEHLYGKWIEDLPQTRKKGIVEIEFCACNELGLSGAYTSDTFCELLHLEGATPFAVYQGEFYKGTPCVTVNKYGNGNAYYIASKNSREFYRDFYNALINNISIKTVTKSQLPQGVTIQTRSDGKNIFRFIINFTQNDHKIELNISGFDLISQCQILGMVELEPYGVKIIKEEIKNG